MSLAPSAFNFRASYWSAQRESVLAAYGSHTPVLTWHIPPPTQEERDSAARETALAAQFAKDAHRPMAIPMGSGGIPLPLFSRGPSREQRRRDSIIFAENLEMLHRLQLRVEKRRDSIRYADSLGRFRRLALPDS